MTFPPTILYTTVSSFNLVWQDQESGADGNLGIWRPILPSGSFMLGDYGQGNYNNPTQSVFVISGVLNDDPTSPALAPPTGLAFLWSYLPDVVFGNTVGKLVYTPLAPDGYVSCGSVGVTLDFSISTDPSAIPNLVCVREDLAKILPSSQVQQVWNDHGSGMPNDLSIWQINGLNTMIGSSDQANPPKSIFVPSNLPNT